MRRRILITMSSVTIIALLFLASQTFTAGGPTDGKITLIARPGYTLDSGYSAYWTSEFPTVPTVTLIISGLTSYKGHHVKFQVLNKAKMVTVFGIIDASGSATIPLALPKNIKVTSVPSIISIFDGYGKTKITSTEPFLIYLY